jgi:hypothetical protein
MNCRLAAILDLGIRDVIVLDTEYYTHEVLTGVPKDQRKSKTVRNGNTVTPVCLCAKSLVRDQEWRVMAAPGAHNPLPMEPNVLYVCFAAPAEWSYFLAMGWDLPPTIIDLYAERMMQTCEEKESAGKRRGKRYRPTLLREMANYGLDAMAAIRKEEMRELVMRGAPYTETERAAILDYCAEDVINTCQLFEAMVPELNIPYALTRGNFTRVVAWWQFNGIPVDTLAYQRLILHRNDLKASLIASVERDCGYGVFAQQKDGSIRWNKKGFNTLVQRLGLQDEWPKTPSGRDFMTADGDALPENEKVFKQMASRFPYLEPLRQVRRFVTTLRCFELFIGDDNRCRVFPEPWWTNTGRANPRNSNFIFTLPKWTRPLIKPGPGQAIAYVDLKSAEVGIAAGLSGDVNMKKCYVDAVNGGDDVYVGFAKLAGAIPPDGNRYTHPAQRKLYKTAMLATHYGQMAKSLAKKNGLPLWVAQDVCAKHKSIYARYWDWIDKEVVHAEAFGSMETRFGWRRPIFEQNVNANALLNFRFRRVVQRFYGSRPSTC